MNCYKLINIERVNLWNNKDRFEEWSENINMPEPEFTKFNLRQDTIDLDIENCVNNLIRLMVAYLLLYPAVSIPLISPGCLLLDLQ